MESPRAWLIALVLVCTWCGGCASFGSKTSRLEKLIQSPEVSRSGTESKELLEACEKQEIPAACAILGRTVMQTQSLPFIQGFTNSKETWIHVLTPKDKNLNYLILKDGQPERMLHPLYIERPFSDWRVDRLHVKELSLKSKYEILALDAGANVLDRREFHALDLEKKRPRIIVASCLDDGFTEVQERAWLLVQKRQPDLIFLIGDNTYADKDLDESGITPEILWNRYVDTRSLLGIFRFDRLTPILATWDDHDYGINDGNRDFPFKNESREVFWAFFPRPDQAAEWSAGPGVSAQFRAFGQVFYLLDNRSFRTPNNMGQKDQTHFGLEQSAWLFEKLKAKKHLAWLISGDQFFGGYHSFESFEGSHPQDFLAFKNQLKNVRSPFVFVSGDRHMSEVMQIAKRDVGLNTFELTSSPLHSTTYPQSLKSNPNSRRLKATAGPYNFMEIESRELAAGQWELQARDFGVKEGLLFEKKLKIGGR